MRIGLIGLGRIGSFHLETLAALPSVEALVVYDRVSALAKQAEQPPGVHAVDSAERSHPLRLSWSLHRGRR